LEAQTRRTRRAFRFECQAWQGLNKKGATVITTQGYDAIVLEELCPWDLDLTSPGVLRFVESVRQHVVARSVADGIDANQCGQRLSESLDVVRAAACALGNEPTPSINREKISAIWRHREDFEISGFGKDDPTLFNRTELLQVATDYLTRPWMQTAELDWLFLDALIYRELAAYKEVIASGQLFGLGAIHVVAYEMTKRSVLKTRLITRGVALVGFCLRWIVLPVTILVVTSRAPESTWIRALAALYVAYLGWRIIRWLLLIPHRRSRTKSAQKAVELTEAMFKAYYQCQGPMISVPELLRAVNVARDLGVVWDAQLFVLLDRVSKAYPVLLTPFQCTA